jgi:hypothetical protein
VNLNQNDIEMPERIISIHLFSNLFFCKLLVKASLLFVLIPFLFPFPAKPFNPYIRRHGALTEKSTKLKLHTLNQHTGWSTNSNMANKYIHYLGNESFGSLLETYGIMKGQKSKQHT